MTAQAITALIARFAACLARHNTIGAARCVSPPSAIFFGDRVNVLNSRESVTDALNQYCASLLSQGLDRVEMTIKAQSMNTQNQCTVWVDTQFSQSKGLNIAQSLTRFFCKPDENGDYKISMFEVLEHDDDLLPPVDIWAGPSRAAADALPPIAERRFRAREDPENARSRSEYAGFTAIDDPQLRDNWSKLVKAKLKQGRGTAQCPNDLFAETMQVYIEEDTVTLRSCVGLFAYLGGFQARLAMAGALESTTEFDTISTNQNEDVLLHGKWVWKGSDGSKYHLADVSYIFENTGKSHKMSVISYTDIDPIMRPSLNGITPRPITPAVTPRALETVSEHQ